MDSQTAAGQPGLGRGHETLPQRCGRPAAAQPALLADMARNPSVHDLIRQGTTLMEDNIELSATRGNRKSKLSQSKKFVI